MNTFYDIAGNRLMAVLLPVLLATRADASNEGVISGSLGVDSTDTLSVAGSLILVIAVILLADFL